MFNTGPRLCSSFTFWPCVFEFDTPGLRKACGDKEVDKGLRDIQAFRNGRKVDSMLMIEFEDDIRYMSFRVKAHMVEHLYGDCGPVKC